MNEQQRQLDYIEKAKGYIEALTQQLGRKATCCVTTFGCQMNARDSEKLAGILESAGFELIEDEDADFVIYNTCTVRDNANQRVYGRLGHLNSLKKKSPHKRIALCGCMMQEPSVIEKIKKSYSFVDLIFGTHNIYKFPELLVTMFESDRMVIDIWKDTDQIVENLPVDRKYPFKSGINIMFGCNNFCSYCIVPYVRGREKSREPKDILREIESLVADGVVEVMLLGQNVNSYGKNLENPMTFAQLLREVEKIDGIRRIRFMTSHPKDLSEELIAVISEEFKKHTQDEMVRRLTAADIAHERIQHVQEVLDDPQALANKYVVPVQNLDGTFTKQSMSPVRFAVKEPTCIEDIDPTIECQAPMVGQHSVEILKEYGYDDAAIEKLMASGVVTVDTL